MVSKDGSYGVEANSSANASSQSFFLTQITLRSLTAVFAIASICVMVNSDQKAEVFGIVIQAKYTYSSAFKFLVGANLTICAFSVITLITICAFHRPNSNCKAYFTVFLHDQIAMVLMISGCAAATAIGYVGRFGQDQTGWTKICDNANEFCYFISISVAFSYLAFLCLFLLTIIAFKRVQQTNSYIT